MRPSFPLTSSLSSLLDFDRLFTLWLVVARYGGMNMARWWHTQEMLRRRGVIVLKCGFTASHYFV